MSTNATGPRTPEGKQRSSLNATKHGLRSQRPVVPGEDPAEWDAFHDDILKDLDPGTTIEREMAERVALQLWRLRRVERYEAEVTADAYEEAHHEMKQTLLGVHADDAATQSIQAMQRCIDYAKSQEALAEAMRDTAQRLPKMAEDAIIDSQILLGLLEAVGLALPEGVTPDPKAGELRRALAHGLRLNHKEAMARALSAAEARCHQAMLEVHFQERRQELAVEEVSRRGVAEERERRLLRDKALDKVMRYEAHVSKQLRQALDLLRQFKDERLAKEKAATPVMPEANGHGSIGNSNGAGNGHDPAPKSKPSFGNRISAAASLPPPASTHTASSFGASPDVAAPAPATEVVAPGSFGALSDAPSIAVVPEEDPPGSFGPLDGK